MTEQHVGIASLSRMTRKKLKALDGVQIVHYRTTDPAAVLLPYWMWARIEMMLAMARDVEKAGKDPQ